MDNRELFDEVAGTYKQTNEKGKPFISHVNRCSRCGGAGGSDKWAPTGWTCYQCGGTGKGSLVVYKLYVYKLYTAEQLAKLNATRDKKNAVKEATRVAAQAVKDAHRAAYRETFKLNNNILFARAAQLNDEFINTMVAQCIERTSITVPQIELIEKHLYAGGCYELEQPVYKILPHYARRKRQHN